MTFVSPKFGHAVPTPVTQNTVRFGELTPALSAKIDSIPENEDIQGLVDLYQSVKQESAKATDGQDLKTLGTAAKRILTRLTGLFHSEVNRPIEVREANEKGQQEIYQVAKFVPRVPPREALALLQAQKEAGTLDADLGDTLREWGMGGNPVTVQQSIQKPYREALALTGIGSPLHQAEALLDLHNTLTQDLKDAATYATSPKNQKETWSTALKEVQTEVSTALSQSIGNLTTTEARNLMKQVKEKKVVLDKVLQFDLAYQANPSRVRNTPKVQK